MIERKQWKMNICLAIDSHINIHISSVFSPVSDCSGVWEDVFLGRAPPGSAWLRGVELRSFCSRTSQPGELRLMSEGLSLLLMALLW